MSYNEFKKLILFRYHKDIKYWYTLVGEMFECTEGFTKTGSISRTFDYEMHTITWNNYEWEVELHDNITRTI